MKTNIIGKPVDRIDGKLKVTGQAKYAAEFGQNNLAYAFPVCSTIASGSIKAIDASEAEKVPGVLAVLTHKNAPRLKPIDLPASLAAGALPGEMLLPLQDDKVYYAGQYVGLVVAETYEQARAAAGLVKIKYQTNKPAVELDKEPKITPEKLFGQNAQTKTGDPIAAFNSAPVKFEQTYGLPTEQHHPMEPHSVIARWEDDNLTVYDSTQGVAGIRHLIAQIFGIDKKKVRIIAPFVGGGFGTKGMIWAHEFMPAMAAQVVKRPVKLVLTRPMMQTCTGNRGESKQTIRLGASRDGKLISRRHLTDTFVAKLDDNSWQFFEPASKNTSSVYACPNIEVSHIVSRLNINMPAPMRAPGEASGMFALESAMDELAFELKIDPIQLRLTNYAEANPETKLSYSSKQLKECYATGAEKFGWNRRKAAPRQVRDGRWLIGYGMATAMYPGYRTPSAARVRINADGTALVQSATQDIGTGTYTIMAQTATEYLGIPIEKIKVELGDTNLPESSLSGGSATAATIGPAVQATCAAVRKKIIETAAKDNASPFFGKTESDVDFGDGRLFLKANNDQGETYQAILARAKMPSVEECVTTNVVGQQSGAPCMPFNADSEQNADRKKYDFHSFGAQFAEVGVDEDLGIVRVRRFVSMHDVGRIMNEKTARNQAYGDVIMGIGMALTEETHYDPRNGCPVVRNLADYHVPVNLDVPLIEVYFTNIPDPHFNTLGVRGVGEIATTGVAAAIANAVFNATGKRVRDLPITPDKLL